MPVIRTEFKDDADFISYLEEEKPEGVPHISPEAINMIKYIAKVKAISTNIMDGLRRKFKEPNNEADLMTVLDSFEE
jgi:hypothetical protein